MSQQFGDSRRAAAVVAGAPLILVTAFALHPYLPGRQPNVDALAAAVTSGPTRWALVHLATGLGSAALAIAFMMVWAYLRHAGEARWSQRGLPLVMIGCALYAMLPAMEFAPLAAAESGGDAAAAQRAILAWFVPVLVASGITFGAGAVCFAVSVCRSGILSQTPERLVAVSLVVMALSRFVPLSAVQFYVQGLACYAALLPLALAMWRGSASTRVPEIMATRTADPGA